jgi:hypothetical protein
VQVKHIVPSACRLIVYLRKEQKWLTNNQAGHHLPSSTSSPTFSTSPSESPFALRAPCRHRPFSSLFPEHLNSGASSDANTDSMIREQELEPQMIPLGRLMCKFGCSADSGACLPSPMSVSPSHNLRNPTVDSEDKPSSRTRSRG